ncbi:MAG: hypothetical protein J6U06_03530 [Spirochaetaceae bacterium]|nr:hypothetical protein [Spirochaetaceae bacterium]
MKKSILFCFAAMLFLQMFSACKKEPQTSINTQKIQSKKTEAAVSKGTEEPLQIDQSYEDQFADMEEDDFFASMSFAGSTATASADGIDIDFTKLNYVMASGIIFDMLVNQDEYLGKRIKIKGAFWTEETDSEQFLAVLLYDATACCQTGLTFKDASKHYPEDYPELLSEIEITGIFSKEEKDGIIYTFIDCGK